MEDASSIRSQKFDPEDYDVQAHEGAYKKEFQQLVEETKELDDEKKQLSAFAELLKK